MGNTINKQTPVTPVLSDRMALWGTNNGRTEGTSLSLLLELFQDNLVFPTAKPTTQYAAPLTGATVAITDGDDDDEDIHLILTPAGTLSTLTITPPLNTNLVDKQTVLVSSTQIVTTLTVSLNGATAIQGIPTTIAAANDYFTLKYDLTLNTWYRVG